MKILPRFKIQYPMKNQSKVTISLCYYKYFKPFFFKNFLPAVYPKSSHSSIVKYCKPIGNFK